MNIFRCGPVPSNVPNNEHSNRLDFNTEYVPIMYLVQNTPIELTKEYIKVRFNLTKPFTSLPSYIPSIKYYSANSLSKNYRNSTRLAKEKLPLDFGFENFYFLNYVKYSGLFYGNFTAFYLLVVKNSYANDFALRYIYGLPIDYSQLEFWVHPTFLDTRYSKYFNPCIEDFKKMDEAGIKVIITENFERAFIAPPKGSSDLDEDAEIQAKISESLNRELIKEYAAEDLPF